ncbi:probable UPF0382 membrane protein SAB0533 [Coccomyxa sp. Obi]|nr:probable UPF0382 membrane protein SAB0533 [Coccomyxa sp. Obi]
MAEKLKSDALITPFMSNAKPAAKVVGWAAGIGATAFAASYLISHNDSNSTASEDAGNSGRSADIKQLDLSRPYGSPSSATRDFLLAAGGVCGLLGVAGGAFGFHGLKRVIAHRGQSTQDVVQFWQIATQYQLYHSAAIVATAALPDRSANAAAGGFLAGVVLFSGSIYAYVLTGRKAFQYLTPFGGLSFMAGWGAIALYHFSSAAGNSRRR